MHRRALVLQVVLDLLAGSHHNPNVSEVACIRCHLEPCSAAASNQYFSNKVGIIVALQAYYKFASLLRYTSPLSKEPYGSPRATSLVYVT